MFSHHHIQGPHIPQFSSPYYPLTSNIPIWWRNHGRHDFTRLPMGGSPPLVILPRNGDQHQPPSNQSIVSASGKLLDGNIAPPPSYKYVTMCIFLIENATFHLDHHAHHFAMTIYIQFLFHDWPPRRPTKGPTPKRKRFVFPILHTHR